MSQELAPLTRTGTVILQPAAASSSHSSHSKRRRMATPSFISTASTGRFSHTSDALVIAFSRFFTQRDVNSFANSCKRFSGIRSLMNRTFYIDPEIDWDNSEEIKAYFNKFSMFSHIQEILFPQNEFNSRQAALNIADMLKTKTLTNLQSFRFLGSWPSPVLLSPIIEICPQLRYVDFAKRESLRGTDGISIIHAKIEDPVPSALDNCEDLQLFDASYMSSTHINSYDTALDERTMSSRLMSPNDLEKHLGKWKRLEAITLPMNFTDQHLAVVAKNTPFLRNVAFNFCHQLSENAILNFVENCPHLERFDITSVATFLTPKVLQKIQEKCPKFHSLAFEKAALSNHQLPTLKILAPRLITLRISTIFAHFYDKDLIGLLQSLTHLRHFTLQTSPMACTLTSGVLEGIASHCTQLRSFYLGGLGTHETPKKLSADHILKTISRMPDLEFLGLHFYNLENRENLLHLGKYCPKLRFLSLAVPGDYPMEWMQSLLRSLPQLQHMRAPRQLIHSLLDGRNFNEVFPQLRELFAVEDNNGFPDSSLRNWGLLSRQIWPPSTKPLETTGKPDEKGKK